MNKAIGVGLGILTISLVAAGCNKPVSQNNAAVPATSTTPASGEQTNAAPAAMTETTQPSSSGQASTTPTAATEASAPVAAATYSNYSPEAVAAAHQAKRKVVLFFHAPWCPTCKAADAAFTANTSQLPAGVSVFKTDYDTSNDLKTKYGVTYQHTFVQIDSSGNAITKWVGGDTAALIKNIK